jgi:hypothetical protein
MVMSFRAFESEIVSDEVELRHPELAAEFIEVQEFI